ncbi:snRNA-activating protein complex subunit 1 [Bactrocera oleae]|uniref:snRNA-activating protein complex subunit 1 n=1 Tax=Bactrocera oleae TaxID=104688 RepID=UPI00387E8876
METAIFEDSRKLIELFVRSGNNSFSSFCEQWKTLQFQHIYFAQTSYIEIIQTTSAIMHYAKRNICSSDEDDINIENSTKNTTAQHFADERMRRRIGCLYLLYVIYFKQPTERYVKIETNLNTWKSIKNFIDSLPISPDMDEPRYIFWRLLQADAFRFTALNYCEGLEDLVDYDKLNDKDNADFWRKNSNKELGQQLQDYPAIQRILPALTVLEDGYNEMKEMLVNTSKSGMHKQSLPATTIFKSIEQCFQNIQAIVEDSEGGESKQKVLPSESEKRNLKRKGFTNNHNDNERESVSGTNESFSKKNKTLRRMSARTVFTDELPDDLLDDLQEQESIVSTEDQDLSDVEQSTEENLSDGLNVHLTESQENCDHEGNAHKSSQGKETIEQQLNELLEIELSKECETISTNKDN